MTTDVFLAALLFAFAASITPGPNNVMLMTSGVNFGFQRTVPHMAGVVGGFAVVQVAVGFGLGALVQAVPAISVGLKVVSAIYMAYLAWKIAFSRAMAEGKAMARPLTSWEAAVFQWVNPKGVASALVAMAIYTNPVQPVSSVLLVVAIFTTVGVLSVTTWTAFGVGVRRFLSSPNRLQMFNFVMGALLLLSIWPMLR
ncbi:LysE family translocator [Consotaella salsifontis]|uniref:Threonine/homoserine/homoserine lactone efflux protein n=1 Tax=Consotaella salsifontis TaxID=1365950 RepID=A0A1T4T7K7_9HYPH|nr:LysE family translocator [Consotaella salsifontis]SKA36416.1 Threonine/homoserine/homoserine lactone efflux protein [Consotaella salsifontis]